MAISTDASDARLTPRRRRPVVWVVGLVTPGTGLRGLSHSAAGSRRPGRASAAALIARSDTPTRYWPSSVRSRKPDATSSDTSRCTVEVGIPVNPAISVRGWRVPSANVRRIATILLVTERPLSEELPDNEGLLDFELRRTSHTRSGIGRPSHPVEVRVESSDETRCWWAVPGSVAARCEAGQPALWTIVKDSEGPCCTGLPTSASYFGVSV